jgi:hypothetical protein
MPTYTVTRLLQSAIHFSSPGEIDEIVFRHPDPSPSDEVLVSQSLVAANYQEAVYLFDEHLLQVVDAISMVGGAALRLLGGSTLVEKKRGKYLFLWAVKRRPSANLTVWPGFNTHLLDDAAMVAGKFRRDSPCRSASHYLRQAALAENLMTSTFHLLQAVEVLSTPPGRTRTNHALARNLMGDDLYEFFYEVDPVLGEVRRNALAHGRLIADVGLAPRHQELATLLLSMLREHFGVSTHSAFSPLRGFFTYEPIGLFLEPVGPVPSLPELVAMATEAQFHSLSDPRWVYGAKALRLRREW